MQILLILVVLMVVMCMFNKSKERFGSSNNTSGNIKLPYILKVSDGVCKIRENEKIKHSGGHIVGNIEACKKQCDDMGYDCKGFNINPLNDKDKRYKCYYTNQNAGECKKRGYNTFKKEGSEYYAKHPFSKHFNSKPVYYQSPPSLPESVPDTNNTHRIHFKQGNVNVTGNTPITNSLNMISTKECDDRMYNRLQHFKSDVYKKIEEIKI